MTPFKISLSFFYYIIGITTIGKAKTKMKIIFKTVFSVMVLAFAVGAYAAQAGKTVRIANCDDHGRIMAITYEVFDKTAGTNSVHQVYGMRPTKSSDVVFTLKSPDDIVKITKVTINNAKDANLKIVNLLNECRLVNLDNTILLNTYGLNSVSCTSVYSE